MIKIPKKYQNLWRQQPDVRYYIITGGRGSAKSYSTSLFLTQKTFEENVGILFTRYTMQSAHTSIIPEFNEKISILNADEYFNVNKTDITNKATKSRVLFRGLRTSTGMQTASLKSLTNISTWVVDEAEELTDETLFDTIDLSIRVQNKVNTVILILNPCTKEHFIYKRFFESRGVEPGFNGIVGDTCYIHTTYLDNKEHLSESFLRNVEQLRTSNPEKYQHVMLGSWLDKSDGVIFNNWQTGEFNNDLPFGFGLDFGMTDPDALVKCAVDEDEMKIYLKEEIYQNGLSTSQLGGLILDKCQYFYNEDSERYINKEELVTAGISKRELEEVLALDDEFYVFENKIISTEEYSDLPVDEQEKYKMWELKEPLIVADSASPRTISDLRSRDLNIVPCKKGAGSIVEGIKLLQDYQLIVDPSSLNLIKELNNYAWDDKRAEKPIDAYCHQIDAIRYYVMRATRRRTL